MTKSNASSATIGYKTDVTKRNFEEFLDKDIVFYLNYSTGSTMALKQDFEEEKIPVLPASFHAGNLEGIRLYLSAHRFLFQPGQSASPNMWPSHHKGATPQKWRCSCILRPLDADLSR